MTNRAARHIAPAKQPTPAGKQTLTAIILAAGMGRRLKSKGPKALFEIRPGYTILDQQIQNIWCVYPNADIIVVTGFGSNTIEKYVHRKYPVRIVINQEHDTSGIMRSVIVGLRANISQSILLLHGDLVFDLNIIQHFNNQSQLILTPRAQHQNVGGIVTDQLVTNLAYGLPYEWQQIAFITGKEFQTLYDLSYETHTNNWFLYEIIRAIIDRGGKFAARIIKQPVYDIDSIKNLDDMRKCYE